MKKIKLCTTFNAPDDFRVGECKKCPIHQESYFSTHQYTDTKIYCPLGFNNISCPIELPAESEEKK